MHKAAGPADGTVPSRKAEGASQKRCFSQSIMDWWGLRWGEEKRGDGKEGWGKAWGKDIELSECREYSGLGTLI